MHHALDLLGSIPGLRHRRSHIHPITLVALQSLQNLVLVSCPISAYDTAALPSSAACMGTILPLLLALANPGYRGWKSYRPSSPPSSGCASLLEHLLYFVSNSGSTDLGYVIYTRSWGFSPAHVQHWNGV